MFRWLRDCVPQLMLGSPNEVSCCCCFSFSQLYIDPLKCMVHCRGYRSEELEAGAACLTPDCVGLLSSLEHLDKVPLFAHAVLHGSL